MAIEQIDDEKLKERIIHINRVAKVVKGGEGTKSDEAKTVGTAVAKALLAKGIDKVVFDRNGYLYHGRVKALAEAARAAGLKF